MARARSLKPKVPGSMPGRGAAKEIEMYTKLYDFFTNNRPHNFPRRYESIDLDYVRCWLKDNLNYIRVHGWQPDTIVDGKYNKNSSIRYKQSYDYPYQVDEMALSLLYRFINKSDMTNWLHYSPGRTQADVEEIFVKAIRATYWEPIKRPFRWFQWYINPRTG